MTSNTRSVLIQGIFLVLVLSILGLLFYTAAGNLKAQGIASGFSFLDSSAGFSVIQSLIDYNESSTYFRVFIVSVLNTILVSTLAIILATILGFILGIARVSHNWSLRALATFYIETFRNIPLLLQIFFWYFVVLRALPGPRQSIEWFELLYLNNRGLYIPFPEIVDGAWSISIPALKGFNFSGGVVLIPELLSLLSAIGIYTASFIAEIVRSGIESIQKGQIEAAHSLGLGYNQIMRFIIIPQAMKVIIPPLTSQYLNIVKNSSLAAAIGYPDLVAVFAGTVLNQTGQAIEVISITMAVYLGISLAISLFMNWYNARNVLVER